MDPEERDNRNIRESSRFPHIRIRIFQSMSQWVEHGRDHRGERDGGHRSKGKRSDKRISVFGVGEEGGDGVGGVIWLWAAVVDEKEVDH
jgi:hypothetical protein